MSQMGHTQPLANQSVKGRFWPFAACHVEISAPGSRSRDSMSESGESRFRESVDWRSAALRRLPFAAQRGPMPACSSGARSALRWRLLHRRHHDQELLSADLPGARLGFESSSLLRFRRGGRARGIPPLPPLPGPQYLVGPGYADELTIAQDVNDLGEITGRAFDPVTGERPAFLATPIRGHGGN